MKISIITLTNNSEKYLQKCIESILEQDYDNKEYVIIDNESTDSTKDILEKYKNSIDRIISEKDSGLSNAMNKALRIATGDFIIFMHSDDHFIQSNSLSLLANELSKNKKANWVTGFIHFIDSENKVIRKDNFFEINIKRMMIRNVIRHQASMVDRKMALEIGFNENLKYAMDYLFFLEFWKQYGPPIVVKEHIANFRLDGKNLSSNLTASLTDELKARTIFRKSSKQHIKIVFDILIYTLRLVKIYVYHNYRHKFNK